MATAEEQDQSKLQVRSREAVAVFDDHDTLVAAIQELEMAGFNRGQMNLLVSRKGAAEELGRKVDDVGELAGEGKAPVGTWVDPHEAAEGRTAIAGGLAYIGSIAAVGAVVASGGGLAPAIAAAVAAGGTGGAVGAWLGGLIGSGQAKEVEDQAAHGGLLLWVAIQNAEQEPRAIEILERHSGRQVRVHELNRPWGADPVPVGDWQPDPLLKS
jgi:hypothetical protein